MDGGGSELVDSVIEMGVASTIAWTVWGGFTDVRNILHRDGSGGSPLRVTVLCHVPVDWEDAWRLSPSGDMVADRVDVTVEQGQYMDIPSPGGGDGGSGNAVGGNLRHLPSKQRRTIYCDNAHYGTVYGISAASRGTGVKAVVVSGGN